MESQANVNGSIATLCLTWCISRSVTEKWMYFLVPVSRDRDIYYGCKKRTCECWDDAWWASCSGYSYINPGWWRWTEEKCKEQHTENLYSILIKRYFACKSVCCDACSLSSGGWCFITTFSNHCFFVVRWLMW